LALGGGLAFIFHKPERKDMIHFFLDQRVTDQEKTLPCWQLNLALVVTLFIFVDTLKSINVSSQTQQG